MRCTLTHCIDSGSQFTKFASMAQVCKKQFAKDWQVLFHSCRMLIWKWRIVFRCSFSFIFPGYATVSLIPSWITNLLIMNRFPTFHLKVHALCQHEFGVPSLLYFEDLSFAFAAAATGSLRKQNVECHENSSVAGSLIIFNGTRKKQRHLCKL